MTLQVYLQYSKHYCQNAKLKTTCSASAPSRPPQNVQLSSLSSTSILITWSPPSVADQNGVITAYQINLTEVDTGTILNMALTSISLTATSLHPYYTYNVVVAAVTVAVGPYSIPAQITTLEDSKSSIFDIRLQQCDCEFNKCH